MAQLLFWRLVRTALAVWALASIVFLLSHRDAAAAVQVAMPDAAELGTTGNATPTIGNRATEASISQRLGLNLPLFYASRSPRSGITSAGWHWNGAANQYHRWLSGLLRGNWGTSFRTGQPVLSRLRDALSFTLPLTGTAALLAVLTALALAQRLSVKSRWQGPVRAFLAAVHGLPLFVVALALLLVFANPDVLEWFPAYGLDQPSDVEAGSWERVGTYAMHMALPIFALTLTALPELTLQLDAALTQELGADYATTARAKGLAEGAVVRHHALRNALLPTFTQLAELLPSLVAGAVVVEVIFALPGMGRLLAEAAASRDYHMLVGGVLITGAARLLALALADFFYWWLDPRIRWQS
ncbi:MAG TPA: ABC transporter permease [Hymenobacter sp.]|jgi:peptide/nickel transport system permease protein|uniref:ABC transporter permease n=1 Tax=Hymenobacter sp. TaxID=1898978 RepID=UPI002EDA99CB